MPLYDFTCVECQHDFDSLVPLGTSETACTQCGTPSPRVWRKAPGVIIRPEGWSLPPDHPDHSKIGHLADRSVGKWQFNETTRLRR